MTQESDTPDTSITRPDITDPPGGPRSFRARWPRGQQLAWWLTNHDRRTMMHWLLTNPKVRELLEHPTRDLGDSPRLRNKELAAIIIALSTPRNPLG